MSTPEIPPGGTLDLPLSGTLDEADMARLEARCRNTFPGAIGGQIDVDGDRVVLTPIYPPDLIDVAHLTQVIAECPSVEQLDLMRAHLEDVDDAISERLAILGTPE